MIDWVMHQFQNNEIFAGLVAASAMGSVLYLARDIPTRLWRIAERQLTIEFTVHNTDTVFHWIELWLARHPYARRARRLKVTIEGGGRGIPENDDGNRQQRWAFVPGAGRHVFFHRGRLLTVNHEIDEEQKTAFLAERYEFRLFSRNRAVVRQIIEEAAALAEDDRRVRIHVWNDGYWKTVARKTGRPVSSVVLPPGSIEGVEAKIEWFRGAEEWFAHRGIPYRLGLLFAGPPGTGKSSLIMALANRFRRPLYVLNLGALRDDDALLDAFTDVPAHALLVIEDIDACDAAASRVTAPKNDRKDDNRAADGGDRKTLRGVSMSALLNVIDGAVATDGRILIMTTNHPEKLDPALVRPGRVDHRLEFGPLRAPEIARMYARFYPDAPAPRINGLEILPAHLQGLFMAHPHDADAARRALKEKDSEAAGAPRAPDSRDGGSAAGAPDSEGSES